MKKILTPILLVLLMTACSQQDFSRSMLNSRSGVVRVDKPGGGGGPTAEERTAKLSEVLSQWQKQSAADKEDYVIGPGDELDIAIYALEVPDQTTHIQETVTKEGVVNLPWIEDIRATGLTVGELEDEIVEAYKGRYIRDPQVAVEVTESRSVAVVMTGAVKNPGVYYLNDNQSSVLEMLAKAGGLTPEAADELIVVKGGAPDLPVAPAGTVTNIDANAAAEMTEAAMLNPANAVLNISLRKLIDEGDLRLNVDVTAGTIITVRSMAQQFVYVLGYVQRPGAYSMTGGNQLDALRAVALAGGLTPTARPDNSFLVRETEAEQVIMPVNLTKIARGSEAPVYLEPGDTLIVGSGTLARLSEFVRPSVGAGMSYSPTP